MELVDSIEIVCSFVGALSSFTLKLPLSPLFKLKEEGLVNISVHEVTAQNMYPQWEEELIYNPKIKRVSIE